MSRRRSRSNFIGRSRPQNQALPSLLQNIYNAAVNHHGSGQLAMAERCCRQILASHPQHADSLHLLGVIGHRAGQHAAAAELIRKAIAVNCRDASYHCNLGSVLHAMGRIDEAIASFDQALRLVPHHPETHNNLGNALQCLGRLDEAETHFRRALVGNPANPQTYNNLANTLQGLGRLEEAIVLYVRALAIHPGYAEAHNNLGNVLQTCGRTSEAVDHYRKAVTIRPNYAEAHNNLGNALEVLGKPEYAIASYERALSLRPNYPEAHSNLGNTLCNLGRLKEAEIHCKRAIALNPNDAAAFNNLGNVLQASGCLAEAAASYRRALALRPNYPVAHMNLGNALQSEGKLEEAVAQYERALAIHPNYAQAHMNKALTDLLRGDFAAGWRGHEWRWQIDRPLSPRLSLKEPQWRGAPLNGARILLHSEQGLGDCIQFLRYIPMVQAAGGDVVLEVPRSMRRIAELLPHVGDLVVSGEPRPPFDCHCPLMSLPLAFGTTLETIPAQVPYLSAPQEACRMAEAYPWPNDGLRVGLVWSGNPKHLKDRRRSIPFSAFEPLIKTQGVHFFSLQVGGVQGALSASGATVIDLAPLIEDMGDTAALIAQLDIVITVDTSVAHLAGALGKPVWLLLSNDPDWRWLLERDDSPWYPTAKLFRQLSPGDWPEVIAQVTSALIAVAKTPGLSRALVPS